MSVEHIGNGYVNELMCLAAYLAGNEQARAEAQQKAGKKA
nr:MAG: hypothetical protein [Bacteriophage sp.]